MQALGEALFLLVSRSGTPQIFLPELYSLISYVAVGARVERIYYVMLFVLFMCV